MKVVFDTCLDEFVIKIEDVKFNKIADLISICEQIQCYAPKAKIFYHNHLVYGVFCNQLHGRAVINGCSITGDHSFLKSIKAIIEKNIIALIGGSYHG